MPTKRIYDYIQEALDRHRDAERESWKFRDDALAKIMDDLGIIKTGLSNHLSEHKLIDAKRIGFEEAMEKDRLAHLKTLSDIKWMVGVLGSIVVLIQAIAELWPVIKAWLIR